MRVLGLDSASPGPTLALLRAGAGGALEEDVEPLPHGAAELLVRRLVALLARAGEEVASLERIAVVTGPGSFTGLRSGIAFARGLARGLSVPLVPCSTFAAAFAALPDASDRMLVLDAGRGDVHAAWRVAGAVTEAGAPRPREAALLDAASRSLPVRDLGEEPLPLASAAARIACAGSPVVSAALPRYGRMSAAEEKRLGAAR